MDEYRVPTHRFRGAGGRGLPRRWRCCGPINSKARLILYVVHVQRRRADSGLFPPAAAHHQADGAVPHRGLRGTAHLALAGVAARRARHLLGQWRGRGATSRTGRSTPSRCCSSARRACCCSTASSACKNVLPLNPQGQVAVDPVLAFNTAASFTTNTNWQNYGGETTMSYLTQMAGLAFHNFASAAVGIVLAVAVIRGLTRRSGAAPGQLLGGPDALRALHPAADLLRLRAVPGLAGRAAELQRLHPGDGHSGLPAD